MIDTHCHLLPGVDDGPAADYAAVELARALVAHGVEHVVCTPHFSRRYPTSVDRARERHADLRRSLDALGIALETSVAAELEPELVLRVDAAELAARSIAGRYLLVELVRGTTLATVGAVLARAAEAGLVAVLAHPERCEAVQRSPRQVEGLRAAGALVQVVAPSFAASAGPACTTAKELLAAGAVDLVASDAHGAARRLRLAQARAAVESAAGAQTWRRLTVETPRRLLAGEVP